MVKVTFDTRQVDCHEGDTLLDTLLAQGIEVPNGCRSGVCQSCLMRASAGTVPARAQAGLKETLKKQGYFLACQCVPETPLTVSLDGADSLRIPALITQLRPLAGDVMVLRLQPEHEFQYRAGQYVTLWRDEHIGRSYSLASVPTLDEELEFHIKCVPGGAFSGWLREQARVGDRLAIQGPLGECFYIPGTQSQPLLLIGTGTGAAPLYGVARDALEQGLEQPIHLFHGAPTATGLYLHEDLAALAARHANFHYHPCVRDGGGTQAERKQAVALRHGAVDDIALETLGETRGWRVYLCGAADFVHALRKRVFLSGARMNEIHADAFLPAHSAATST